MIDCKIENFTASEAVEAGLLEAIQRGDCIVNGSYKIAKDGHLELKQNNFVFNDKGGNLRVGKFMDNKQLIYFVVEFVAKTENWEEYFLKS